MEKNCRWHFGSEGGIDIGPNDPIHQTFKGNPYYSIVREAIQNSLDAVNDLSRPVIVSFDYFDLDRTQFPEFFKLELHIKDCREYFGNNSDAKLLFNGMLKYLEEDEKGNKKKQTSCLRISDSNTKGMHYIKGDTTSSFYAFLRAAGVSSKQSGGSGGSFGFGKGAYFALSPIKTVIVSSKDINGKFYFEGATRLTTHISDGKKLSAYGFYDNNNGEPVYDLNKIPVLFQKKETGTDINIIGLWNEDERNTLMVKSVLNNFWLSIHESKLIVKLNETIINKENLEQTIDKYFTNEFENGSANEIESWNPKPYFKAIKYSNASDQFKLFSDRLNVLGDVKLYVYLEKGLPNRTSYFRSPKMVVFKKTSRKINGYAAVFICDNENGNNILRLMENPAHNEWSKDNYPKDEGKINKLAKRAEAEFIEYVNERLDSLSKINTSKKVAFLGLEEFLSIPEDLLEKDEESNLDGDTSNTFSGNLSSDLTDEETGIQTTSVYEPITNIKPSIINELNIIDESSSEATHTGVDYLINGGSNNADGGDDNFGTEDGNIITQGDPKANIEHTKILLTVKLKVAAQKENDTVYHNLIINSEKLVLKAELEIFASGDNDKEDGIEISSSSVGIIHGNKLKGISLSSGNNYIKVRFLDNLKHSIRLKAYELQ